ncbi:MAG: exo-alpha-sialidase [Chloroflexi bacterium]|nr:exo-alpha-sialidase [Chloroflexota bacterium]MYD18005.1 exo-alpha-sialidase [Chloroflexota bacterium]MYJ02109.1 exo-alpha-sialidase [Chloroflexota bacterium]
MPYQITIHVGTMGQGPFRSLDGGRTWQMGRGQVEAAVRSMAVFPNNPERLLAGADHGLLVSDDNGETWQVVEGYEGGEQIWSISVDPSNPDTIFAGGHPGLRRSRDGGATWEDLAIDIRHNAPAGIPRTTSVVIDPLDSRRIYAGIEVDGVHKSLDGGDTWSRGNPIGTEFFQQDVHHMGRAVGPEGAVMYATSPFGVARSDDEGESWLQHEFPPLRDGTLRLYSRGMLVKYDDPNTIFVAGGDDSPGITGAIQRSTDGGRTWSPCELPYPPNSMFYWLASHPEAPDTIAAATLHGYVYLSEDGGDSWRKLEREFGEIRALVLSTA